MILAMRQVQTLVWFIVVFIGLLLLYPLSLSVAAQRNDLMRVEREIARTKAEIRYLETEFATRASLRQLETWNKLDYGYVAPSAAQYLEGERELANLGNPDGRMDRPVQVAAITIDPEDVAPTGAIGKTVAKPLRTASAEAATGNVSAVRSVANAARSAVVLAEATAPSKVALPAGARALGDTMVDRRLINRLSLQATVEGLAGDAQ